MAKVIAPLFGFGAAGQLGKAIVNASWRGRPYVRRYVIPSNPRSVSQMQTRSLFRWLQEVWKRADPLIQAPWFAFAKGQPLTDRNAYTQINIPALLGLTATTGIVFSNGAKGGLVPTGVLASAAASSLSIAFTVPTPPTGWSVNDVVAAVVADQDPQTAFDYETFVAEDLTATSPLVITGLTTGTLYNGGIWLVWNKPDGSLAYSPQVPFFGTPS